MLIAQLLIILATPSLVSVLALPVAGAVTDVAASLELVGRQKGSCPNQGCHGNGGPKGGTTPFPSGGSSGSGGTTGGTGGKGGGGGGGGGKWHPPLIYPSEKVQQL